MPSGRRSLAEDHWRDPLHDPTLLIFAYTAWAGSTVVIGPVAGLAVLVLSVAGLLGAALRHSRRRPRSVPFHAELGVTILFCAGAIASATLVLIAATSAPRVTALAAGLGVIALLSLAVAKRSQPKTL